MLCTWPLTWFDSCSYLYSVPTLSPNHSQLAPLLNNHSFHLQFPATHAPPCFIKPSHPSQKHPHKRTTLLFVCLKTRGTLSHFLFTSGNLHKSPLPHLLTPNGSANTESMRRGSSVKPVILSVLNPQSVHPEYHESFHIMLREYTANIICHFNHNRK